MCDNAGVIVPYILTLANRNDPICHVAQGGQGKYCFMSLSLTVLLAKIANVNDP
jgi:hypothetical protein